MKYIKFIGAWTLRLIAIPLLLIVFVAIAFIYGGYLALRQEWPMTKAEIKNAWDFYGGKNEN